MHLKRSRPTEETEDRSFLNTVFKIRNKSLALTESIYESYRIMQHPLCQLAPGRRFFSVSGAD